MYANPLIPVIRKAEQIEFRKGWRDPEGRVWIASAPTKAGDRYVEALSLNSRCGRPERARFLQRQCASRFW